MSTTLFDEQDATRVLTVAANQVWRSMQAADGQPDARYVGVRYVGDEAKHLYRGDYTKQQFLVPMAQATA